MNSMEEKTQKDPKLVEVKCQCVHGICDKGEAFCSRCDVGWSGHLCDTPKTKNKIEQVYDEVDHEVFRPRSINDQ